MVEVKGTVHGVHPGTTSMEVNIAGRPTQVSVPVVVVEVVGASRSWTFDLHTDEAEALGITEGEELTLTLTRSN